MPKHGAYLVVANQLIKKLDKQVFLKVLGGEFEILSLQKEKLAENVNQNEFYTRLFKRLKTAQSLKQPIGIIINFSHNRLDELGKRRGLNRLMKLVKKLDIPIVPMRLQSNVNPFFYQSIASQQSLEVTLRIGNTIGVEQQQYFEKNSHYRKFIQSKIFALGTSLEVKKFFRNPFRKSDKLEAIEPTLASDLIEQEIQELTFNNLIASQSEFDIFVAEAKQIPHVLLEIGRLRELTFRIVGEGTGKSRDLDEFDLYYKQLIIWDRKEKKIVGGYRMGLGDAIFERYGIEGFYINSVFKISKGFFSYMKTGVELGRSYIVPAYQKKRWPLFLLWKGILYFLLKHPQYQYLYGPVSISKYYSNVSKSLIVAFIEKFYFNEHLAQFLKPRKPFKVKTKKVDIDILMENMSAETRHLDTLVEDIEPNHFRMPVLIRQYLKLNARFISFNVDPNFSDCLDGFIILNLKDIPYATLEALKKEN